MDLKTLKQRHPEHFEMAAAIRALAMDAVEEAQSGHPGMPMGMADIATVLFSKHLKFDATSPDWPDRDRFVVSNGHGSMLLYALLHLTGYEDMPLEQIKAFRQVGSRTPGHPEVHDSKGIETTTGPLGQGLATAVGFAIAEESLRARYGRKVFDHHTYVFVGDGCLMEGISHEAIGLAGMQKLSRLIVLFDDNRISIDGDVALSDITDQTGRFEASCWQVLEADGHDPASIDAALTEARSSDRPTLIRCRTIIGIGAPNKQDSAKAHGSPLGPDEIQAARTAFDWPYGPFEVPEELRERWLSVGRRGAKERKAWEERFDGLSQARRSDLNRILSLDPHKRLQATIRALKKQMSETRPKVATRKSSEMVLEVVNPVMTEMMGGSADLTGSNNTRTGDLGIFDSQNRKGRYIHYGIREHGMAAAMNGLALHGGIRPYGGTFLTFSDYARGGIRLSALMQTPVVYVMTHDSIGLGEDGPTHQSVEHLAICRATPNLLTFRPADTVETAECWEIALTSKDAPSILALSRQNLPTVRLSHKTKNLTAQGAYVLADAEEKRQVILMASGSEVEIALAARDLLQAEGIGTRVVSVPCMELFATQDETYRRRVLPAGPVRVAVEAAVRQPWDRWLLGERGREAKAAFVGMEGFGASGKAEELYEHFGITAQNVAARARGLL
jgi:transketolase